MLKLQQWAVVPAGYATNIAAVRYIEVDRLRP